MRAGEGECSVFKSDFYLLRSLLSIQSLQKSKLLNFSKKKLKYFCPNYTHTSYENTTDRGMKAQEGYYVMRAGKKLLFPKKSILSRRFTYSMRLFENIGLINNYSHKINKKSSHLFIIHMTILQFLF